MKKSLTNDILICIEIWSKSHLRIKSTDVRLMVMTSCPNNINQMKPMSLFFYANIDNVLGKEWQSKLQEAPNKQT